MTLRELLAAGEPIVAPGAYDALSARLVEQAGFPAVYMTGFGASASLLGRPDVGLLSFAEMVDHARRLVQAVDVPVIADADDGYGNDVNVRRTIQEYEAAGVAALHIEDQVAPKRCGHMAGKEVIPASEMVLKVRAAVEARRGDLVIIARTDARAIEGLDAALERARAYRDAGADVLFVEAPEDEREIEAIAAAFPDPPSSSTRSMAAVRRRCRSRGSASSASASSCGRWRRCSPPPGPCRRCCAPARRRWTSTSSAP